MTLESKQQLTSNFFAKNYEDYLTITKKISIKSGFHFDIASEDILSLIYENIYTRLDKIPDRFFDNKDQFRSIFIKTLQSQTYWKVSILNQFKSKLKNFVTTEDRPEVKINGEYIINDPQQDTYEEDNHELKLSFLNNEFKETCNSLENSTHNIIFHKEAYTNSKFSEKTNIDLTSSAKFIRNYKSKVRFTYDNIDKIKSKKTIGIINDLHPSIKQKVIDIIHIIETNHPIQVEISKGLSPEKPKSISWLSFGLAFEIDNTEMDIIKPYFENEGFSSTSNFIVNKPSITLEQAISQKRHKHFIKGTNYILI